MSPFPLLRFLIVEISLHNVCNAVSFKPKKNPVMLRIMQYYRKFYTNEDAIFKRKNPIIVPKTAILLPYLSSILPENIHPKKLNPWRAEKNKL